MRMFHIQTPAEWMPQDLIQLTWPHKDTDWAPILDEVETCFAHIAHAILEFEPLLIVCRDKDSVCKRLGDFDRDRVFFAEISSNDTWARDHGGISVFEGEKPILCDFVFNGWGMKFASDKDNLITRKLFTSGFFSDHVHYRNCLHFVLEGGSIESDGAGTLLTTSACLLSKNRNDSFTKDSIEHELSRLLGFDRYLWLNHGFLRGDDTDSHIDTLARFCNENTIAYVQCNDCNDEHFMELKAMEDELKAFRTRKGLPYQLIALPMADRVDWRGERLPATYANFLILNGGVLVPIYNSPKDAVALSLLQQAFPDRKVIGVDCLPLIKQHGSLHCVTMQYPQGFVFSK